MVSNYSPRHIISAMVPKLVGHDAPWKPEKGYFPLSRSLGSTALGCCTNNISQLPKANLWRVNTGNIPHNCAHNLCTQLVRLVVQQRILKKSLNKKPTNESSTLHHSYTLYLYWIQIRMGQGGNHQQGSRAPWESINMNCLKHAWKSWCPCICYYIYSKNLLNLITLTNRFSPEVPR